MVILLAMFLKDRPFMSVFEDKHSTGTSPESGLHIYLSASFHFEFRANPSGDKYSHVFIDLNCNATSFQNKLVHFYFKKPSNFKRKMVKHSPLSALVNE